MKNNRVYQNKSLQKQVQYTILDSVTFKLIFRRMVQHIRKYVVALNNLFHKTTLGVFSRSKFPYAQLTLLALIIFVLTKKDLHFQMSMNAPLAKIMTAADAPNPRKEVEQLSMVKPIKFVEAKKENKVVVEAYDIDFKPSEVEAYIKRFGKVAMAEQQKYGIPASIKMAQGLLESRAGRSEAAQENNNHFGVPLGSKSYESAWINWRTHSHYLTDASSPYSPLLKFGIDYKKWARGLKDLGYSRSNNYDQLLIELIEKYEMFRLDKIAQ